MIGIHPSSFLRPPSIWSMHPLTLDDLLPLEEYAPRRREFFATLERYLDRYRRVRVGPRVTLLFENRQTLWFRVQELLRVARLADPPRVQQELDVYNRLLPTRECLQAALLINMADEGRLAEEQAAWRSLRGEEVRLRLGETSVPAELLTNRAEDLGIGAAHWIRFHVDAPTRELLSHARSPATVEVCTTSYRHASLPLSGDLRQSLLDDLVLSDRDTLPRRGEVG
jgi:hypothetical protein